MAPGIGGDAGIVLAQRHMRAVLLGAAGGNDDGGLAAGDGVARFVPGELLEIDRVGCLRQSGSAKAQRGRQDQQAIQARKAAHFSASPSCSCWAHYGPFGGRLPVGRKLLQRRIYPAARLWQSWALALQQREKS
jgi:hypothetical protein